MDKVIIWRKLDGGLSFTRIFDPTYNDYPEAYAAFLQEHRDYAVNHAHLTFEAVVDVTAMPDAGDHMKNPDEAHFKGAWVHRGKGKIVVDPMKAVEIHKQSLRVLRAPKLLALDVEHSRAYKDPAKQDEIEAKRKVLRDVTDDPKIKAAKTLKALRKVIPAVLKEVTP